MKATFQLRIGMRCRRAAARGSIFAACLIIWPSALSPETMHYIDGNSLLIDASLIQTSHSAAPVTETTKDQKPTHTLKPTNKVAEFIADTPKPTPKLASYKRPADPLVKLASLDITTNTSRKLFIPPALPKTESSKKRSDISVTPSIMGSMEVQFNDWQRVSAWNAVSVGLQHDIAILKNCVETRFHCADGAIKQWAATLSPLKQKSEYQQLVAVNNIANRLTYTRDSVRYGRKDYWAKPSEMLAGAGDCEDYALLKFASLQVLGINKGDMRIVVGQLTDGTPHAVLAVKLENTEYILDNRQNDIRLIDNSYIPKYSVNLSHRWTHFFAKRTS